MRDPCRMSKGASSKKLSAPWKARGAIWRPGRGGSTPGNGLPSHGTGSSSPPCLGARRLCAQ
eukprot:10552532-Alexandrium_andersonii.AAC.1